MSDDNGDNATMSDNNTDDATLGDDNAENVAKGETSTDDVPSPLLYGRKTTDPSKVKTSEKHKPIWVTPLESSIDDPPAEESTTKTAKGHTAKGHAVKGCTAKGHAFDPTDVRVYGFFIQGATKP